MKTYFASIFTAVASVPFGLFAACLLLSLSYRPDIQATATIGAVVTVFFLLIALVLFLIAITRKRGDMFEA